MKEAHAVEVPQALMVRGEHSVGEALAPSEIKTPITAAQAKIEAVASLTMKAYEAASTLRLTPEEVSALQADFSDDAFQPGAAGKEHLIYIEHAHLRDRLNQVFGPGQWAIVPRNRWAEPFTTARGTEGSRVYVEAMLVIRGAFVAEAIGAMEYYPKNESQNYGDAVEGAKTAALRRCAKELGIGLQAWKKDWCDGWWKRRRGVRTNENAPQAKTGSKGSTQAGKVAPAKPQEAGSANKSTSPATRPAQPAVFADDDTRNRLISQLKDCSKLATEYFQKVGCLMDNEGLEDLPLRFVPVTRRQFQALQSALAGFGNGEEATGLPYPPNPEAEPAAKPASQIRSGGPEPAGRVATPAAANSLGKSGSTPVSGSNLPASSAPNKPADRPAGPGRASPQSGGVPGRQATEDKKRDPAWFFGVICPVPYKGMKRDEYLKQPDTIGSLYKSMKEGDEGAQKRLWGFAKHWNPEPRTVGNRTYPASPEEVLFREALDDFCDWEERHGKDTQADLLPRPAGVTRHQVEPVAPEPEEEDIDIPF